MDRFSAAKLQFENDLIKSGQENVFVNKIWELLPPHLIGTLHQLPLQGNGGKIPDADNNRYLKKKIFLNENAYGVRIISSHSRLLFKQSLIKNYK